MWPVRYSVFVPHITYILTLCCIYCMYIINEYFVLFTTLFGFRYASYLEFSYLVFKSWTEGLAVNVRTARSKLIGPQLIASFITPDTPHGTHRGYSSGYYGQKTNCLVHFKMSLSVKTNIEFILIGLANRYIQELQLFLSCVPTDLFKIWIKKNKQTNTNNTFFLTTPLFGEEG